jgi:hypothetical protein
VFLLLGATGVGGALRERRSLRLFDEKVMPRFH